MSEQPIRASDTPFAVEVEQGRTYWWCACGKSASQPFCDGTHKTQSTLTPVKYEPEKSCTVYFCGCKSTGNVPMCDGSHGKQ